MKDRSSLPEDDKIGCAVIKEMRKDVADLKKNEFFIPRYARWTCFLGLIIAIGFCVRSFCPSRISKKIVYEIKLDKASNAKAYEGAIKKGLAEALVDVEARAAASYNDKFTALLAVLTIFGIAWPVIVAVVQHRFNEKQLHEVHSAISASEDAQKKLERIEERYSSNAVSNWANFKTVFDLLAIDTQNKVFTNLCRVCSLNCLANKLQEKHSTKISHEDFNDLLSAIDKIDPKSFIKKSKVSIKTFLTTIKLKIIGLNISTNDDELQALKRQSIEWLNQKINDCD